VHPEVLRVVVFDERLRFAALLQVMADELRGSQSWQVVLDLSAQADRDAWPGTMSIIKHARTLRLTGWAEKSD
jgi:hypothetical protein